MVDVPGFQNLIFDSFLVEDMLKKNGGIYSKGDDWAEYVLVDGNLITGQNPASSGLAAEKLYDKLK